MIGIFVAIVISWVLLFLIAKKSILALGFLPIFKRLQQFSLGFVIMAIICVITLLFESFLKSSEWVLNDNLLTGIVLESFYWDFKSVLTEELIFRGALLYILIQKLGSKKGVLISAIAFGVYHWFSYGIIGNVMAMVFVFVSTGLMGYAWALAFSKAKSILLPIGLHFGWNFINNTVFSKGPLGEILFVSRGGINLEGWIWIVNFVVSSVIVPVILILYIKNFMKVDKDERIA